SLRFVCRDVRLRVERTDTPFTSNCEPGQRLTIPVKHGEGCWFADEKLLTTVEANGQVVLRYDEDNPNGSLADVAAVANADGNVMGLMPHPEYAVDPLLGSSEGGPPSPSASASAGCSRRTSRRRARSRLRSVTGPRRATPPVV